MANFSIDEVRACCCEVLPLQLYECISTPEILSKLTFKVNELITSNNALPDFIEKMIIQYITAGPMGDLIGEILRRYILTVKNPPNGVAPAVGDGSADDTEAFQTCLDYASANSLTVYVPSGKYLVGPLTMDDNCALIGSSCTTTEIILRGGANNPVLNASANNIRISGVSFNANSGVQVNNVDCVSLSSNNAIVSDCEFINGFDDLLVEKKGGTIILENLRFVSAIEHFIHVGGTNGIIKANNLILGSLSTNNGLSAIFTDADYDVYDNIIGSSLVPIGVEVQGNNNKFSGVFNAEKDYENTGTGNNFNLFSSEIDLTYDKHIKLNSKDIELNPINPLTYREPERINYYFDGLPMLDTNGNPYTVLVKREGTELLYRTPTANVLDYGADNSGVADSLAAFNSAINACKNEGYKLVVPPGTYLLSKNVFINSDILFLDYGEYKSNKLVYKTKTFECSIGPGKVYNNGATDIVQGMCYNYDDNTWVVSSYGGGSAPDPITVYNDTLSTVIASYTTDTILEDIVYSTTDKCYYAAGYDNGNIRKYTADFSSYTLIPITGSSKGFVGLSFDTMFNVYVATELITANSFVSYVLDYTLQVIKTFSWNTDPSLKWEGSNCYFGTFIPTMALKNNWRQYLNVIQFDYNGELLGSFLYNAFGAEQECQGIAWKPDGTGFVYSLTASNYSVFHTLNINMSGMKDVLYSDINNFEYRITVNENASANGDGSFNSPFNSLADAVAFAPKDRVVTINLIAPARKTKGTLKVSGFKDLTFYGEATRGTTANFSLLNSNVMFTNITIECNTSYGLYANNSSVVFDKGMIDGKNFTDATCVAALRGSNIAFIGGAILANAPNGVYCETGSIISLFDTPFSSITAAGYANSGIIIGSPKLNGATDFTKSRGGQVFLPA